MTRGNQNRSRTDTDHNGGTSFHSLPSNRRPAAFLPTRSITTEPEAVDDLGYSVNSMVGSSKTIGISANRPGVPGRLAPAGPHSPHCLRWKLTPAAAH